ncbi:MAG: 16S rRNA (cytidine(1402)-2'-O)-methyltransferase [Alphaproteobacteria bacterium]|nr:16S rRNA (cytidine(1402)-2'-O)-methyltransferase [Alphaproteobacteria bacterium]
MASESDDSTGRGGRSKSEEPLSTGLYLVATPIGNARDVTLRALHVLASADVIFAEDTRVTSKLLAIHELQRPMHSYREHNAHHAEKAILRHLAEGHSVALVSDAGTPLVSDPGQSLVQAVVEQGFEVIPIPGPSAILAALTTSGLATDRFLFAGFLPARATERRRAIREFEDIPVTLIFFEAPSRLADALTDLSTLLGPRMAAVARELTKIHEEINRGTLPELAAIYGERTEIKGEIVILVAAAAKDAIAPSAADLDSRLAAELERHPMKDAAAIVAAALGLPRREVYARALALKKTDD